MGILELPDDILFLILRRAECIGFLVILVEKGVI